MGCKQRLLGVVSAVVVAAGTAECAHAEILCLDGLSANVEAFEWLDDKSTGISDMSDGTASAFGLVAHALADRETSFSRARAFANHGYLEVWGINNGLYSDAGADSSSGQAIAHASFLDNQVVVDKGDFETEATGGTFMAWFKIQRGVTLNVDDGEAGPALAQLAGGMNIFVTIGGADTQPEGKPYGGTWFRPGVGQPIQEPDVASDGLIGVPVDYTYGEAFTIAAMATLNLISTIQDGTDVPIDADFGADPAFQWMGITELDGQDEGVTVSSPCNHDWTVGVVPAPGPAALLIAAMPLGLRRRR
ncbi:MAG: hypothetical protein AAFX05_02635 [Planctomycetota bacterium]